MRKFLKVGMSEEDYNILKENAHDLNITISKLSRELLKNGEIIEQPNNKEILYHLNKIGNNLNQIARFANSNKLLDVQIYNLLLDIYTYIENINNDNISK